MACGHALERADGEVDFVPLLFLDGEEELHEVGADGEVGGVAGDDEGVEVATASVAGLRVWVMSDDVAAEGVHLGVELDGGDAVAEVDEGGAGVLFDDAVRLLDGGEGGDARRLRDGLVGAGVSRRTAAGGRAGRPCTRSGRIGSGWLSSFSTLGETEPGARILYGGAGAGGVHHLEGAELPVEAGLHGLVDRRRGGGLGHLGGDAVGGVGEELGEEGQ